MLSNSPINDFFAAGKVNVQERERESQRNREGEADTCKWFSGRGSQHETNSKMTSRGKIG